jgi:hypothetical protein
VLEHGEDEELRGPLEELASAEWAHARYLG